MAQQQHRFRGCSGNFSEHYAEDSITTIAPTDNTFRQFNSLNKNVLGEEHLARSELTLPPNSRVAAVGLFKDPVRITGREVAPKSYLSSVFLDCTVKQMGAVVQERVCLEGAARTTLLLVDSVLLPAVFSAEVQDAIGAGIPIMSYAAFLAQYYIWNY